KAETGARPEQLAQAEAAAEAAEAQYELAQEGSRREEIEGARAALEAAEAQRDDAQSDYRRSERLLEQEVIPERDYEQAKHRYEGAEAQVRQAREKLSALQSGSRTQEVRAAKAQYDQAQAALDELREGAREEDIESARAAVDAARADLRKAERGVRETRIHAPANGVVESLDLRKGDLVSPGPAARLADPEDLTLTVYVSALALGHLRVGQTVALTTDSHGDAAFEGTLTYLASQGEFTPRNLQTQEERAQQVFGVEIRTHSHDGKLKAGMTATAHFDLQGEEIAWAP
ncbi:MAG: HlyD family secretion protein, partial [Candidatus Hydrogenedentota bacterium]